MYVYMEWCETIHLKNFYDDSIISIYFDIFYGEAW